MSVVFFETVRRHVANVAFVVLVAMLCAIAAMVGAFGGPPQVWQGIVKLLAIILACQLIGPEFSSGTLQLILAKPVNRSMYVIGRVFGVVTVIWLMTLAPFFADALARGLLTSSDPAWAPLIGSTVNALLVSILMTSLMAFYGSFTRSYFNVAVYFLLQIVLSLIVGAINSAQNGMIPKLARFRELIEAHPMIQTGAVFVHDQFYPDPAPLLDPKIALLVFSNSAIALLLASIIFSRREVPYGAD